MTTGTFSQSVGKLFSELKLATDNLPIRCRIDFTSEVWYLSYTLVSSNLNSTVLTRNYAPFGYKLPPPFVL